MSMFNSEHRRKLIGISLQGLQQLDQVKNTLSDLEGWVNRLQQSPAQKAALDIQRDMSIAVWELVQKFPFLTKYPSSRRVLPAIISRCQFNNETQEKILDCLMGRPQEKSVADTDGFWEFIYSLSSMSDLLPVLMHTMIEHHCTLFGTEPGYNTPTLPTDVAELLYNVLDYDTSADDIRAIAEKILEINSEEQLKNAKNEDCIKEVSPPGIS